MSKKDNKSGSLIETIITLIVLVGAGIGSKHFGSTVSFVLTVLEYLAFIAGIGYFVYKIYDSKRKGEISNKIIFTNVGALFLVFVIIWFSFPVFSNEIIYPSSFITIPDAIC